MQSLYSVRSVWLVRFGSWDSPRWILLVRFCSFGSARSVLLVRFCSFGSACSVLLVRFCSFGSARSVLLVRFGVLAKHKQLNTSLPLKFLPNIHPSKTTAEYHFYAMISES